MLFIRRGPRAGAISGMVAGLIVVLLFTPLPKLLLGSAGDPIAGAAGRLKTLLDIGFCGLVVNCSVFALVSLFTPRPDPKRTAEFARIMRSD